MTEKDENLVYEGTENKIRELLKRRGIEGKNGVKIYFYSIDEDEDSYEIFIDQTIIIKKELAFKEEK